MNAPTPSSLEARLTAIARTLRLPTAETPPDVSGHWYRQAADVIDEAAITIRQQIRRASTGEKI